MAKLARCVVLFAFLAGCSRQSSSHPEPQASASSTPVVIASVADPEGVCLLSASSLAAHEPVALRLEAGGIPFASLEAETHGGLGLTTGSPSGPSLQVRLLAAPQGAVSVRYESRLLRVHGFANASELPLFFGKPSVSRGFVIPLRLDVETVGPEGIVAGLHLGKRIEVTEKAPSQRVTCADLSLEAPKEPRRAAPPARNEGSFMLFRPGQTVDLAVQARGAPVARLRPNEEDEAVQVIDTQANATRIVWETEDAIVFGWVPSSALAPAHRRSVEGSMGRVPHDEPPLASHVCATDVPLLVGGPRDRRLAGAVRAGARIDVVERADGAARIRPPASGAASSPIEPAEGASFWVKLNDVDACPAAPKN